jgi:hypothetical protein
MISRNWVFTAIRIVCVAKNCSIFCTYRISRQRNTISLMPIAKSYGTDVFHERLKYNIMGQMFFFERLHCNITGQIFFLEEQSIPDPNRVLKIPLSPKEKNICLNKFYSVLMFCRLLHIDL